MSRERPRSSEEIAERRTERVHFQLNTVCSNLSHQIIILGGRNYY